jgi:hypothetical protein
VLVNTCQSAYKTDSTLHSSPLRASCTQVNAEAAAMQYRSGPWQVMQACQHLTQLLASCAQVKMAAMHHSLDSLRLELRELASGDGGGSGAEGKAPGQVLAEGCALVAAVREQVGGGWWGPGEGDWNVRLGGSMSINVDQCRSMSINVDQCQVGGINVRAEGEGGSMLRVPFRSCACRNGLVITTQLRCSLCQTVIIRHILKYPNHLLPAACNSCNPTCCLQHATCNQTEEIARASARRLELARTQLDLDRGRLAALTSQLQGLKNEVLKLTELNKVSTGHWALNTGYWTLDTGRWALDWAMMALGMLVSI